MGLGVTFVGSPPWGDRWMEQQNKAGGAGQSPSLGRRELQGLSRTFWNKDVPTGREGWGTHQARCTEDRAPRPWGQE